MTEPVAARNKALAATVLQPPYSIINDGNHTTSDVISVYTAIGQYRPSRTRLGFPIMQQPFASFKRSVTQPPDVTLTPKQIHYYERVLKQRRNIPASASVTAWMASALYLLVTTCRKLPFNSAVKTSHLIHPHSVASGWSRAVLPVTLVSIIDLRFIAFQLGSYL